MAAKGAALAPHKPDERGAEWRPREERCRANYGHLPHGVRWFAAVWPPGRRGHWVGSDEGANAL